MTKLTLNLTLIVAAAWLTIACSNQPQPTVVYQTPATQQTATYVAPPANVVYASGNPCDAIYYNPILCRQALGFGGYYNSLGVYMALSAMHDWAWYNSQETYYVHSHPGFHPTTVIINNPPARVQSRTGFTNAAGSRVPPAGSTARQAPVTSYNGSAYKTQPGSYGASKYSAPVVASRPSVPVSRPTPSQSFSSSSSSGRRFGK